MAGKDVVVSSYPYSHVSRHQFDALLASHRAFHEVAIKVTDILQDSSISAYYQSFPGKTEDDLGVNHIDYGQNVLEGSSDTRSPSERHAPHQEERKPAPDEALSKPTFMLENARARKAYNQKRQRSINFYAGASGSEFGAKFDFQCMLVLLSRSPKSVC